MNLQHRFFHRFLHKLQGSLFCFGVLTAIYSLSASAQNYQRDAEEVVKDQERDLKLKRYLEERKNQEQEILNTQITPEELEKVNLVEVEPNNILPSDLVNAYALVPYKIRRPRWGQVFTVTYSLYNPLNYESDYLSPTQGSFDELYGSAQTPLLELSYSYKWNFTLGSIGGELAYGTYQNDAADSLLGDAQLELQQIRVGAKYIMDNIWEEPKFAPYAMVGGYQIIYNETQAGVSLDGTTFIAPYFGAGVYLQLGWLDPSAAVDAYTESGIENTFVFLEIRKYIASTDETDPDFSTSLDLSAGLSIEF